MKRFLKKINRGIVLGIVLLFCVGAFIGIKGLQFYFESPDIREASGEAIVALAKLNTLPDGATFGVTLTEEQKNVQRQKLEEVFLDGWDQKGTPSYDHYYVSSDIRTSYEEQLLLPACIDVEEVELNISDRDYAVKANGTNYALVSVNVTDLSVLYRGDGEMLFFTDPSYLYDGEEEILLDERTLYRGIYTGYVDVELHRVNGEWRVIGMSGYIYLQNKVIVEGGAS